MKVAGLLLDLDPAEAQSSRSFRIIKPEPQSFEFRLKREMDISLKELVESKRLLAAELSTETLDINDIGEER